MAAPNLKKRDMPEPASENDKLYSEAVGRIDWLRRWSVHMNGSGYLHLAEDMNDTADLIAHLAVRLDPWFKE